VTAPRIVARKLRTLAVAGPEAQALVVEAALRLLTARVELAFRPFAQIAGRLGDFVAVDAPDTADRPTMPGPNARRTARRIGWAVRATAAFMPFRAACLQQAVAAQAMLRRRGITGVVHLGMDRRGDRREAHAWLEAAGVRMTGYPIDPYMVEIGRFI
jgi:hypothetical protein